MKRMSPGSSGSRLDKAASIAGTEKIRSRVRPCCIWFPLTEQPSSRSSGLSNSSGVTSHGPVGPKPGSDFARLNCGDGPAPCSCRSEMSWPTVSPATWSHASAGADPEGAAADDGDELDLPVGAAAVRQLDLGDRAGDAARPLGEHDGRFFRHGEAGLGGVLGVVQPDGEHLPRRGRGRAQVGGVEGCGCRTVLRRGRRGRRRPPSRRTPPSGRRPPAGQRRTGPGWLARRRVPWCRRR